VVLMIRQLMGYSGRVSPLRIREYFQMNHCFSPSLAPTVLHLAGVGRRSLQVSKTLFSVSWIHLLPIPQSDPFRSRFGPDLQEEPPTRDAWHGLAGLLSGAG
jgi:hypothetical protein